MHRTPAIIALTTLALAGCAGADLPSQPSFYRTSRHRRASSMRPPPQSMISGYRANNGLGRSRSIRQLMQLARSSRAPWRSATSSTTTSASAFTQRIRGAGFDAKVAVENIGAGYHTLAEAFSGWRDSPPHRANMLNKGVTRMGIAAVYSPKSKYKVFWTLIMASPDDREG